MPRLAATRLPAVDPSTATIRSRATGSMSTVIGRTGTATSPDAARQPHRILFGRQTASARPRVHALRDESPRRSRAVIPVVIAERRALARRRSRADRSASKNRSGRAMPANASDRAAGRRRRLPNGPPYALRTSTVARHDRGMRVSCPHAPGHVRDIFVGARHEQRVREPRGGERLAQTARRQHALVADLPATRAADRRPAPAAHAETHRRGCSRWCRSCRSRKHAGEIAIGATRAPATPASACAQAAAVRRRIASTGSSTRVAVAHDEDALGRSRRPYPRVRMAGRSPRSRSRPASAATTGVLPLPPVARLPTLITG